MCLLAGPSAPVVLLRTSARDESPCDRSLSAVIFFFFFPSSILLPPQSPSCKLIPLLVSTMPAPSTGDPSPRGVKRSRTPDHSGNGLGDGDHDDGTCAIRGGRRGTDSGRGALSSVSTRRRHPFVCLACAFSSSCRTCIFFFFTVC